MDTPTSTPSSYSLKTTGPGIRPIPESGGFWRREVVFREGHLSNLTKQAVTFTSTVTEAWVGSKRAILYIINDK